MISTNKSGRSGKQHLHQTPAAKGKATSTEPTTGLRIRNPLVGSEHLRTSLAARSVKTLAVLSASGGGGGGGGGGRGHLDADGEERVDTCGVLASKSGSRTTAKGGTMQVWRLSDLRGTSCTCVSLA